MRRLAAALVTVALASSAAGCAGDDPAPGLSDAARSPFADCAAFVSTPTAPTPSPAPAGKEVLVDVELPCFTGGAKVHTGALRGPLVINLWASWCAPCRKELPAFQRLADKGRVGVLGVATMDRRDASISLADDLGLTFPTLFDSTGELRRALGEAALPITIIVDASGRAVVHTGPALTDQTLAELVQQNLGLD